MLATSGVAEMAIVFDSNELLLLLVPEATVLVLCVAELVVVVTSAVLLLVIVVLDLSLLVLVVATLPTVEDLDVMAVTAGSLLNELLGK